MNGKIHGLCTIVTRIRKQINGVHLCRLCYLIMTFFLLWVLSGCESDVVSEREFPPTLEKVQAAANELHWTVNREGTQSWEENHVLYNLETEEQTRVSLSCALADGKRILMENCVLTILPDKPQFAWEDWEKAVTLAETLYGGFSDGELYQALSEQDIPEPEVPSEGIDEPVGQESLRWEVELPSGYVRIRWSICAGTVEKNFPSPTILDWRMTFTLSIYESKAAYESTGIAS